MKKIILVTVAAIITGILLALALSGIQKLITGESNTEITEISEEKNGCYVTGFFAFSDEDNGISDVAAIKLENSSDINYRYIEVKVKTEDNEYSFLASTLPAQSRITVLESGNATLSDGYKFVSAEIVSFEAFEEAPSLMEDKFSVEIKDGSVEIKNISGEDINKNINIYIKATDDFGYFGGMTYKLSVGTLKADETKTIDIDMPVGENPQAVFIAFDNES